jgi:hypothetical protein
MRNRRVNLLPRHAVCKHRQRMAQIDHLIQADAKEIAVSLIVVTSESLQK